MYFLFIVGFVFFVMVLVIFVLCDSFLFVVLMIVLILVFNKLCWYIFILSFLEEINFILFGNVNFGFIFVFGNVFDIVFFLIEDFLFLML